jgi:hypothetical protein
VGRSCGAWSGAAGGWWRAAGVVGCAEVGAEVGAELWDGDQRRFGSVEYGEPESVDGVAGAGAAGWTCHELVECMECALPAGMLPAGVVPAGVVPAGVVPAGVVPAEACPPGHTGSALAEARHE